MNETERTGPNIRTALLANARGLSGQDQDQAPPEPPAPMVHAQPVPAPLVGERSNFRLTVKRLLRPVIGALYRLAKPICRPIAFRWRAYLLAPLQAEFVRTTHTMQAVQAAQAVQARQDQLQQIVAELHALRVEQSQSAQRQQEELATIGLQVLQELDTARDALTGTAISAARTAQHQQEELMTLAVQALQKLDTARDALTRAVISAPDVVRLGISFDRLERIEQYTHASARRVAVPGDRGEILVRTSVGYLLCSASDYPLLATLVDVGELELGTRLLIQTLLRPGETFIDVGANIGMHTLAAAIAMKASGRIVAFEPHPVTHELLRKSILLNGFAGITETHQAAASNRPGRLPLFLGVTSGHHSLYPLDGKVEPTGAAIDVPLVRIDDTIKFDTPVDLIKIDVEGAELNVLEGARATIARSPGVALIVEFGFSHLRRTGHSTADWLRAFGEFGFDFRVIEPATGVLLDWPAAQLETVESVNLLFAHPASKAWERARSLA